MTNEQLAILLEGIAERWFRAIGEAERAADAASPRLTKKQHVSLLSASGWNQRCLMGNCTTPEHFEVVIDEQPIVQPLYHALDELQVQIGSLRGEPTPEE